MKGCTFRWAMWVTLLLEYVVMPMVETGDRDSTALIYVYGWDTEGLKYDLSHLFTTGFWIGGRGSLLFTGTVALVPDLPLLLPVGKLGSIGHFRVRVTLLF